MKRKMKLSVETFLKLFEIVEEGYSFETAIRKLNLNYDSKELRYKYHMYLEHGIDILISQPSYKKYSKKMKEKLAQDYFNKGISLEGLAIKYNIRSKSTVRLWINQYTEGKKNKSDEPEVYIVNPKKTTVEERIEIVKYCLDHNITYKEASEKFNLKYSQLYSWIQKYKEHGKDGLIDGRGKGKPQSIMTSEEELNARIKALEERNKYLEMENEVLKKEEEIERQLMKQRSGKKHPTKRSNR